MKRREFITLLGSAAATWPIDARAQQASMPIIGFLHSATADSYLPQTTAFRKGLNEAGFVEGQNVTIEYRWAENQLERLPGLAADLVRRQVSVISSGGGSDPPLAAKAATSTIPIVFVNGTDPVEAGLVASLNRPGGNVTGITFLLNTLGPKEVEVLHELVPGAAVIAVLLNPKLATADSQLKDVRVAASTLGLQIQVLHASAERDFDAVFASLSQRRAGGLIVGADAFFYSQRDQLVGLATRYSAPTVYPWRDAVAAGGLASYGASLADAYRAAGMYTGRILKGEKAADLPVQRSTKIELIINLKTAKSLGFAVPMPLLGRADEVIE